MNRTAILGLCLAAWLAVALPVRADGPSLLGVGSQEAAASPGAGAPATLPAAPAGPRFAPGFFANGLSSWGGALAGSLVATAIVAFVPMSGLLVPFAIGAALAGSGSALAQHAATGKIDWRSVFFQSLAGGGLGVLGLHGPAVLQALGSAAMLTGIGQFFGSVRETTRVRRLWFW